MSIVKKAALIIMAFTLLINMIRPNYYSMEIVNASGAKLVYETLETAGESMIRAMKSRSGIKFETKNGDFEIRDGLTEDQFIESFKKGMTENWNNAVSTINGAALNSTPVAGAPGWLKATIGTGLFISGLDSYLEVYNYFQDSGKVDYIKPVEYTVPSGVAISGYGGIALKYYGIAGEKWYIYLEFPDGDTHGINILDKHLGTPSGFRWVSVTHYGSYNPAIHDPYGYQFYIGGTLQGPYFLQKGKTDPFSANLLTATIDKTKMRYTPLTQISWNPEPAEEETMEIYYPDPSVFTTPDAIENEIENKIEWIQNPSTYIGDPIDPDPEPEPTESPIPTYNPLPMPSVPPIPTPVPQPDPVPQEQQTTADRTFFEWLMSPINIGIAGLTGLVATIGTSLSNGLSSIGATLNSINTKTSKCQCIDLPPIYKPWLLVMPFLLFLVEIVIFMVKVIAFVTTIATVSPVSIDNSAFQWFRTFSIGGVQIYNVISALAAFGLGLTVFKIIRRRM